LSVRFDGLFSNSLKEFKVAENEEDVNEIYFANIRMVTPSGIFEFRAFVLEAMLR
jgi:hypothetical protein